MLPEVKPDQTWGLGWLIAGLALLLAAWAIGNAPFTSPDEAGHFVRAASLVRGQLVGDPVKALAEPGVGRAATRLLWQRRTTRSVTIPASLDPAGLGCNGLQPQRPALCSQAVTGQELIRVETPVGTYDPLPALVPGLATLILTSNATAALDASRLAGAALALALLAAGLAGGAGFWSRLGLCIALTPGALFVLSSVSPNSLEVAGSCALSLSLFRSCVMGADDRRARVAMAAGGFAMVASRPTSVIWLVVAILAAGVCLGSLPKALAAIRTGRYVVVVWALGAIASVAWESVVEPPPPRGLSAASLRAAVSFIPEMVRECIGVFGPLDTRPPWWLAAPALGMFGVLFLSGLLHSTRRARVVLALVGLAAIVLPTTLNATVIWFTGFALQGRHVMALVVMAPIFAGVVLDARSAPAGPWVRWGFAATWAVTQVAFWLFNAHRHAVGVSGTWFFLGDHTAWLPGPWGLWFAIAAAGAGAAGVSLAGGPRASSASVIDPYATADSGV
jgi:hypothetical protein